MKKIMILCGVLFAAVQVVPVKGKEWCQAGYVCDVNSAAESVFNYTQMRLTDIYGNDCNSRAEEPLHDGIYRAEYDPKAGTLTYCTTDGETEVRTDWKSPTRNKMYFIIDIRDCSTNQVCACRSNTLTEADLVPAGRGVKEADRPPTELTLAGFWPDRYIAYLNYDYTPRPAESA